MKRISTLLLMLLMVSVQFAFAQSGRVTGAVKDTSGDPIVGATVLAKGTTTGTTVGRDGTFTLDVPSGTTTLVVSFLGFFTQELTIGTTTHFNVVMKPDDQDLDDIIVVAYGTAKRSAYTGSAGVLSGDDIVKMQVSNAAKALEGQVSGVQVVSNTGQPGSGVSINVRGIGSISAGRNPLIVVDGVPYSGSINSISSQDIENMTVLKDAAATALYGSRGSNGVVIITTKKGKAGKSRVTVDAKMGVNSRAIKPYNVISSQGDYYEMAWEAMRNTQVINGASYLNAGQNASANLISGQGGLAYNAYDVANDQLIDPLTGRLNSAANLLYNDNWFDEMFTHGTRQEYSANVQGGNESTNYYYSANYLKDEGYVVNSDFTRISQRLRLDHDINSWAKIESNVAYGNTKSNTPSSEPSAASSVNMFYWAQSIAPIYPVYLRDEDGAIVNDKSGQPAYDYGGSQSWRGSRPFSPSTNPLGTQMRDLNRNVFDELSTISAFHVKFDNDSKYFSWLTGLKFTASVSYENINYRTTSFMNPVAGQGVNSNGVSVQSSGRLSATNLNQLFNYYREFNDHSVSFLAGHESFEMKENGLFGRASNVFDPDNTELSNAGKVENTNSTETTYALDAYLARGEYNYANKYFGSVSYRRDGSSRFHPDNRWGSFWSVGGAWRMDREDFMSGINWVNELKLKLSYGGQGNESIATSYPNLYQDLYTVNRVDDQPVLVYSFRGNPNLTWEKSNTLNTGLEFKIFDKVFAVVEFYQKDTRDMIYFKPLPPSLGSPSNILVNDMDMRNTGVEFDINYTPIDNNNIKWTVALNGAFNKNELKKLASDKDPTGYATGNYWRKEGGSLYDFYLVEYAGVDSDTGEALFWHHNSDGTKTTTNVYNYNDRVQTGKSALPKMQGGISTVLDFYGFDLSIYTSYRLGGWVYDGGYAYGMRAGTLGSNWHKDIYKRWTPENRNTDVPRVETGTSSATDQSTRFLTKANYFSLRNVTLGYTLPQKITEKAKLERVRIYATGDNLFFFSARQGMDPRMSTDGEMGISVYSQIRTISGGLTINF